MWYVGIIWVNKHILRGSCWCVISLKCLSDIRKCQWRKYNKNYVSLIKHRLWLRSPECKNALINNLPSSATPAKFIVFTSNLKNFQHRSKKWAACWHVPLWDFHILEWFSCSLYHTMELSCSKHIKRENLPQNRNGNKLESVREIMKNILSAWVLCYFICKWG